MNVVVEVDNPNIIGADVSSNLDLYEMPGEKYIGPGTIPKTHVSKQGKTDLTATFNVSSSAGLELSYKLYIAKQPVDVMVKGSVYIYLGLIKPSVSFSRQYTIPPQ